MPKKARKPKVCYRCRRPIGRSEGLICSPCCGLSSRAILTHFESNRRSH